MSFRFVFYTVLCAAGLIAVWNPLHWSLVSSLIAAHTETEAAQYAKIFAVLWLGCVGFLYTLSIWRVYEAMPAKVNTAIAVSALCVGACIFLGLIDPRNGADWIYVGQAVVSFIRASTMILEEIYGDVRQHQQVAYRGPVNA